MKKKFLSLILAFAMLAAFVPAAHAEIVTDNEGTWSYNTETGTLTLNSYDMVGGFRGGHDIYRQLGHIPMVCKIEGIYGMLCGFDNLGFYNFHELFGAGESWNYGDIQIGDNSFNNCDFSSNYFNDKTGYYETDNILIIPDNITDIGSHSFIQSFCKSIQFSSGMKSIKDNIAAYCDMLESVSIPASITEIDDSAFFRSDKITDVYYSGTVSQWKQIKFADGRSTYDSDYGAASILRFAAVHCSDGDIQPEKNWYFNSETGILTVDAREGDVNFEAAEEGLDPAAITEVYFIEPQSGKSVRGFNNLVNLKEIKTPSGSSSFKILKANSFNNCGVESAVIGGFANEFEENTFNNCKNLKSVRATCKNIPSRIFTNCPSLTSLEFSVYSVASISAGAFSGSPIADVEYYGSKVTKEKWNDIDIIYNENGANDYPIKNAVITFEDYDNATENSTITYVKNGKCSGTEVSDVMWLLDSDGVLTLYGKGEASFDASAAGIDAAAVSSVRVKSGITSLSGFSGMTKLSDIHLPISIQAIDSGAFSDSEITKLAYKGTMEEWKAANLTAGSPLKSATVVCSDGEITPDVPAPTSTPAPVPSTQDLYTIADGKTTFHVPVKTQDTYKVDVRAYYYEDSAEKDRGVGSVTSVPTEVNGVYRIDVEIPCEIQIGDRVRIATEKQNQQ